MPTMPVATLKPQVSDSAVAFLRPKQWPQQRLEVAAPSRSSLLPNRRPSPPPSSQALSPAPPTPSEPKPLSIQFFAGYAISISISFAGRLRCLSCYDPPPPEKPPIWRISSHPAAALEYRSVHQPRSFTELSLGNDMQGHSFDPKLIVVIENEEALEGRRGHKVRYDDASSCISLPKESRRAAASFSVLPSVGVSLGVRCLREARMCGSVWTRYCPAASTKAVAARRGGGCIGDNGQEHLQLWYR